MTSYHDFLDQPIQLEQLGLHVIDLPQKMQFRSGIGVRKSRKALIVSWTAAGVMGYGECSSRADPYYSAEFLAGSVLLVEQFIAPALQSASTYREVLQVLDRVRGWPFTKAAVEFAMHDWLWRTTGRSIFDWWKGARVRKVPVGISIGILPDAESVRLKVRTFKAEGYRRLKFKVNPSFDLSLLRAAADLLQDAHVSFDANGTLMEADIPLVRELVKFGTALEQPFPPYRVGIARAVQAAVPDLKICLDESVKSLGQLKMAHELGLLDELNLKIGRVGGLFESLRILEYGARQNLPIWIGGMFETGIGRSLNLQMAALLPDAKAHDLSPSSRYFDEDILQHPITMSTDGLIDLSAVDRTVDPKLLAKYTIQKKILTN